MSELHEISLRERIRLNLISAMKKADINQVQLAEKLGISKGTVNNWARGNNSPDVDIVPKICDVLGISILDLFSAGSCIKNRNSPSTDEAALGDEQGKSVMTLVSELTADQQEFLLAWLKTTIELGKQKPPSQQE
ncbi:MAG: helix-turn-helix transcriptional regulator [Oscillibacter sp.]|nr:helix-turn-helix transcriptional regulator [Oscillibacter sp.]